MANYKLLIGGTGKREWIRTPKLTPREKTVLLVDDDASIRAIVSRDLKNHYNVLIAESGLEAIRRSRDFAGEIHLLLTDFQLRGMDGIELATQIAVQRPEIKVLLMSGLTDGVIALNEGWHFLPKPLIPSRVLATIAGLVSPGRMLKTRHSKLGE